MSAYTTAFAGIVAAGLIATGYDHLQRPTFPEQGKVTFTPDGAVGLNVVSSRVFTGRGSSENIQKLLTVTFNNNGIPTIACVQDVYQIAGSYRFGPRNTGFAILESENPDMYRNSVTMDTAGALMSQGWKIFDTDAIQLPAVCINVNSTIFPDEIHRLKEERRALFPNLS